MKKIIKKNLILLLGVGLFTYGLFSFGSGSYEGITMEQAEGCELDFDICAGVSQKIYPVATYYYYDQISLILLTIGAIFIVIDLLKMRKKN
jgi:hypothetical protein